MNLRRALVILLCLFLSVSAFAFTDADGDGMDDDWEKKYGLDPTNPMDADLDNDGDKVSNLDEYKKGTDPNDGKDRNGNGIPDDWEIFHFGKAGIDPKGDADKDGFTNKQEYDNSTNPNVADKKADAGTTFTRPATSMSGVSANGTADHKHVVGKNHLVFLDPIGDDKGPGYYTYPTNPVYVKGGFDITKVEIDGSSKDSVVFKVTVNADLKQEWGMAADFDIQFIQIYIDTDGEPGSGHVQTLPGLNLFILPAHGWEKVVVISPQPESRVSIEVEAKAKDMESSVAIPKKIVGQGRTLIATVLKRDLGVDDDTDITKWKFQVFSQSNEGFPDKEDLLTRNVNEYNGLHRFGGGNDYWGDPEVMDMLAFPAKGLVTEAQLQFDILNVWESYPDPTRDIKAVVPMVWADQDKPVDVKGMAVDLAAKMKPKPKGDKYVSENFDLFGKMFTRWTWNLDIGKENFIKNSFELGFDGKVFTDKLDFYLRLENAKWDLTIWNDWYNDTPGQFAVAVQATKLILTRPIPTIDMITIGNYEMNYSPWIMGGAWYPDRDKYKGIFIDGAVKDVFNYKVAAFYNLDWIALDGSHGNNKAYDISYAAKVFSKTLIKGLDIAATGVMHTDYEANPLVNNPGKYLLRATMPGAEVNADYKLPVLAKLGLSVGGSLAWSRINVGEQFKAIESYNLDIDGNSLVNGGLKGSINNMTNETSAYALVLNVKGNNILGSGINVHVQYFNISDKYCAPGAARGDTAFGAGGFGSGSTAATADVLAMIGNQSPHRKPQAADFTSSVPIPQLPADFLVPDPYLSTSPIGWVNDNWEGIATRGWKGFSFILRWAGDVARAHIEYSPITFNAQEVDELGYIQHRIYGAFNYSFLKIGRGLTTTLAVMYEIISHDKYRDPGGNLIRFFAAGQYQSLTARYLSPFFTVDYNWTKSINTSFTLRLERGMVDQDYNPNTDDKVLTRVRFGLNLNISTPLGFLKTKVEYWKENADAYYGSRAKYGAYAITEWEYAF